MMRRLATTLALAACALGAVPAAAGAVSRAPAAGAASRAPAGVTAAGAASRAPAAAPAAGAASRAPAGVAAAAAALRAPDGTKARAASTGACSRALPVSVRAPTLNAKAFERLGVVRVTASARVRSLHVMLKRDGRMVAQGSRGTALQGSAPVRLRFSRHARPGRASLLVTGRVTGCQSKLRTRRTIALDRRNLPVSVAAADSDPSDGRFTVTLRRTGSQAVSGVRLRVLDARGTTIDERARPASLGAPARIEFEPRERPAPGRYWLLVTATVRGERGRSAVAKAIDLGPGRAPAGNAPGDPPPPAAGAVVQQVAVSWSGGRWQGADSAGFTIPGIGDGQLVCRPDTQWVRVFPSDRSREAAMTLWTFRDWEGGSEVALREAQMTAFTGADFNEGFNKFTPPEKRSHGSFTGIVGDGLPAPGTWGAGRAPTELRLSWNWDFEDPAGARCSVVATLTSAGPGSGGAVARGLALGWNGESGVPADTTLATPVPGLGIVRLRCDPRPDGARQLVVEPTVALTGLTATTYEGSESSTRALGEAPYVVALPNNGLVEAATPSGAPLRIVLASRWKANDPDAAQNFCRLSGLVVSG
jgi:hypothetical protein